MLSRRPVLNQSGQRGIKAKKMAKQAEATESEAVANAPGQWAYEAYREAMGGEGVQGPMPGWLGVPNEQQAAWAAVEAKIISGAKK